MLPPSWVVKNNLDYYRRLLREPHLIRRAVIIDEVEVAIPVGKYRLAGDISIATLSEAKRVINFLKQMDGFPNLRIERGNRNSNHSVYWGVQLPSHPKRSANLARLIRWDIKVGVIYGYKLSEIVRHIRTFWINEFPGDYTGPALHILVREYRDRMQQCAHTRCRSK